MKYKVLSRSLYTFHSEVATGQCPLNWIAEFYKEHLGKLVEIDDVLLSYVLVHADNVRQKREGNSTVYELEWLANENHGHTKVLLDSHGSGWIGDNTNRNFITSIEAEDLPSYYLNTENRQIVFLSAADKKLYGKTINVDAKDCPFYTIRKDYDNMQGINAQAEFNAEDFRHLSNRNKCDFVDVTTGVTGDESEEVTERFKYGEFLANYDEIINADPDSYMEILFSWEMYPQNDKKLFRLDRDKYIVTENKYADPLKFGHETDFSRSAISVRVKASENQKE